MQVLDRSAIHGWYWIRDAFKLFLKSPMLSIALLIVWLIIWLMINVIPFVGAVAMAVLSPVFLAGLMAGYRHMEQGEELELAHLFAGFKGNLKPLITLGVISLVAQLLIGAVMMFAGFKEPPALPAAGQTPNVEALRAYVNDMLLPMLIGLALLVPVSMATWFAPTLLMFNKMSAIDAIKWSFYACVANFVPFMIYGLVMLGFMMLLPFTLFLGLLLLVPLMVITFYTAYRDIFVERDEPAAQLTPPENV